MSGMPHTPDPRLDPAQAAVVDHRGGVLLVLGAPGTGLTTALVQHVRRRLAEGLAPDRCLVLAPTRQAAARLRSWVGEGLGQTHTEPLARTPSSLAFSILRLAAARSGEPLPRLISGAEQDVVLRELLAGHAELGTGPSWPAHVAPALGTTGFRAQLRDLLMRAVERGLEPADLERLAVQHERPEWACAASVLAEYDQVTALSDPGSYDPAWICTAAADALEDDEELRTLVHGRLDLLVVDDAQELTASAARLVQVVRPAGSDAVLGGDPDATVLGFRGALPGAFIDLARTWSRDLAGPAGTPGQGPTVPDGPPTVVLRRRHGCSARVAEVADRIAERVGVVGARQQRRPEPTARPGVASAVLARSPAQEAAHVARWLRHAHLVDKVPWEELGVIARSGRQQDTIRRALASGGVPVRVDRSGTPLGQDPAVRPFLVAFDVVTRGIGEGVGWTVSEEEAVDLLTGPIGGLDPVGLRRLRRALRAGELAAGGSRTADQLVVHALEQPDLRRAAPSDLTPGLEAVRRVGRVLDAGADAATGGEAPGSAEDVIWALWESSGAAATWSEQVVAGGALGARADRDLDAVLVLFGAAEAYVDRLPGSAPRSFLDHVRSTEVAADTLVQGARVERAVEVLTPQAAAGRRWRRVAVVGVQDGVWPDLRLRDTLLGGESLVAALAGRPVGGAEGWRSAQAQVRADELRQFHVAVTRADEELLVSATSSPDEQPSGLLDLVDPGYRDAPPVDVPAPMTLRGLVGELRRTAVRAHRDGDRRTRDQAVEMLLRLDQAGVPGADPASWWHTREVSVQRPVQDDGPVRVSPSRVQTYLDCPLRWFLTSRGADTGEAGRAEIGTLVHAVIADAPHAPVEELRAELDRRWPDLGLPQGWVADRALDQAHTMLDRYDTYSRQTEAEGRVLLGTELDLAVTLSGTVPDGHPGPGQDGEPGGDRGRGGAPGDAATPTEQVTVRLTGAVDRLERDTDGRLVVADLKTGTSKPSKAEVAEHAQLEAYQVALEHGAFADLGERSGGARLVQLGASGPVAQVQAALGDTSDPERGLRRVLQVGAGMRGDAFTAKNLERRCRTCPARFACPLQPEGTQR